MRISMALWLGLCVSQLAFAVDLDQARTLLNAGKAADAYLLLNTDSGPEARSTEHRFLLGLAALQSGHLEQARELIGALAIERPEDAAVRALHGRVLVATKAFAEAEHEFREALKGDVPAPSGKVIEGYLENLTALATAPQRTRWQASLALGGGYETNANRATEEAIVAVPLFSNLEFALDGRARETGSAMHTLDAGAVLEHNFTSQWSGSLRGLLRRLDFTADDARLFDQDTYNVSGGVGYAFGRHQIRGELDATWFTVDNDLFRSTAGGTLSWRMQWRPATRLESFFQGADVTYHPHSAQSLRDVTRWVGGVGATQILGPSQKFIVSGGFHGGIEEEKAQRAQHLGRSFYGARLSPQWLHSKSLRLFVNLLIEASDYGAREPLFLRTRDDTYWLAAGGLAWRFAPRWSLEPSIQYTRNRSNLTISDYDSLAGRLNLRIEFN